MRTHKKKKKLFVVAGYVHSCWMLDQLGLTWTEYNNEIREQYMPHKCCKVNYISKTPIDAFDFENYSEDMREEEFHKWLGTYLDFRQKYWASKSKREVIRMLRAMPECEPDYGLWELPKYYQKDRDIVMVYLEKRNLQFVPSKWLRDEDVMLWYLEHHINDKYSWKCYSMISKKLLNDVEFISKAIELDPNIYFFASKKVQNDKFIIMQLLMAEPEYIDMLNDKCIDNDVYNAYQKGCRINGLEAV